MIIIGITGGVGSGKSALLQYIGSHYKACILRSDEAAHATAPLTIRRWRQGSSGSLPSGKR